MCTEERARVYEASVHNLQSAYDTYIKNTVLEEGDERLPRMRGHISCAFHLLEAVTDLVHFVERHEGSRSDETTEMITRTVDRDRVIQIAYDGLLAWAVRIIHLPFQPLWLAATACEAVCQPFGIEPPLFRRRADWFRQNRAFSIEKARLGLGYEPKIDLPTGLAATANWYRQHGYL